MAWSYDLVANVVSIGMWRDWVLSVLPYLDGYRILELGHGPGHLQKALLEDGKFTIGIDESVQMGHQTKKRLIKNSLNYKLVNGIAQSLPFPDNFFDHIVATFPSEYILVPDTINEIHRVLAQNGCVVILPIAWITGNSFLEKCASWLFNITGQSPEWLDDSLDPFLDTGFHFNVQKISINSNQILIIEARKFDLSSNMLQDDVE
jgi:ubiquinone/menaquinone biosynthesis C-methylase UbiE